MPTTVLLLFSYIILRFQVYHPTSAKWFFSCLLPHCQSSSIKVFSMPGRNFLPSELNTWENEGKFHQILFQGITIEGLSSLRFSLLSYSDFHSFSTKYLSMNPWKNKCKLSENVLHFFFLCYLSHLSRNHFQTAGRLHIKNYFSVRKISFYSSMLLFENFTF